MADTTITATILMPRPQGREPVVVKSAFLVTLRLTTTRGTGVVFTLYDAKGQLTEADIVPKLLSVHGLPDPRATTRRAAAGRWTYLVGLKAKSGGELPAGRYHLHAVPTYSTGTPLTPRGDSIAIEIVAKPVRAAKRPKADFFDSSTVDYPERNHQIDVVEQVFFYATGQATNPVWSATISDGRVTRYASYVVWVPELTYWVAEFLFLGDDPGPGEYDFQVQANPDPGPVPVVIL